LQNLSIEDRDFIKTTYPILKKGNIDIYYAFLLKCLDHLNEVNGVMVAITPNTYLFNRSALSLRKYFIENKFIREIIDFESEKVFKKVSTYVCITIFTKTPKEFLIYNGKKIMYEDINTDFNIFGSKDKSTDKSVTLKDICTIRNGIATLRDKIYIHKHKLFHEPCWKPMTKFVENNWIIYPYDDKGCILEEQYFKNDKSTNVFLFRRP
jgi:type I restriction-modification system DNA methylase subunit